MQVNNKHGSNFVQLYICAWIDSLCSTGIDEALLAPIDEMVEHVCVARLHPLHPDEEFVL